MGEGRLNPINPRIAPGLVEPFSGNCGAQFEALEARLYRGAFTSFENFAANPAAGPIWMYKEGSDSRVIPKRVEQIVLAARSPIASKEGLALAPTSPTGDRFLTPVADRFVDQVRNVDN